MGEFLLLPLLAMWVDSLNIPPAQGNQKKFSFNFIRFNNIDSFKVRRR